MGRINRIKHAGEGKEEVKSDVQRDSQTYRESDSDQDSR